MDGDGRKKKRKVKKRKSKSKAKSKSKVIDTGDRQPTYGTYGQYIETPNSKVLKPKMSVTDHEGYERNIKDEAEKAETEAKYDRYVTNKETEKIIRKQKKEEALEKRRKRDAILQKSIDKVTERTRKEYEDDKYDKELDKELEKIEKSSEKKKGKTEREKKEEKIREREEKHKERMEKARKKQKKGSGIGHALYDKEIWEAMKVFPNFVGVVARDEILKLLPWVRQKRRVAFVVNSDPHDKGGEHWYAVYIDARPEGSHSVEFYDSFGRATPKDLKADLKLLTDQLDPPALLKFKENHIVNQDHRTNSCGYMASRFLIDRLRNVSFSEATHFDSVEESEKNAKKIPEFKYL